jgi:hypothetical protein
VLVAGLAVTGSALLVSGCTSSSGGSHPGSTTGSGGSSAAPGGGSSLPGATGSAGSAAPSASAGSGSKGSTSAAPYPTPSDQENPPTDQTAVLDALPGSAAASCAAVGKHSDLRSGSIAMGNFVSARKQYLQVAPKSELPEVNVYVIPKDTSSMKSATVTVDPLGRGATRKVTSKSVQDAADWRYFAVQLPVAAPGSYRLTVVAGPNRGCFDVTFGK